MVSGYRNRKHAGQELAEALTKYAGRDDVVVLGLPRGGIPVAAEVARVLNAPLDIFAVRKLGVPRYEELAMGAIASGGARVLNYDIIETLGISPEMIAAVAEKERRELDRRESAYRNRRPFPKLEGKTVILGDDGLATGSTMKAAVQGLKQYHPAKIIVAVPTGSEQACKEIARLVDEVLCLIMPPNFGAVGIWYDVFDQTSDEEVRMLLQEAHDRLQPA